MKHPVAYDLLVGDDVVDLICTFPPYNVPIDGHVCGSGRIRHRDFAMGVGEMNKDEFTRFLVDTLAWRQRVAEMERSLSFSWTGAISATS